MWVKSTKVIFWRVYDEFDKILSLCSKCFIVRIYSWKWVWERKCCFLMVVKHGFSYFCLLIILGVNLVLDENGRQGMRIYIKKELQLDGIWNSMINLSILEVEGLAKQIKDMDWTTKRNSESVAVIPNL